MKNVKIRRTEGKTADEYNHTHVGGTTLCADYAKRALDEAIVDAKQDCDRLFKKCKYSNNYPSKMLADAKIRYFSSYV